METDPIRIDTSSIASKTQHDKEVRAEARQVSSDESFEAFCDEGAFTNPWAADKKDRFKLLSERRREAKEIKEEPKILAVDKTEDSAKKYQEKNQELDGKKLQNLLKSLKKNDSITDILKKVADYFLDVTLQDDALDFLIENAEGELQETLQRSKEELNRKAGSQIVAGRNIALQAREFSEKGLGTPTALRDLYRDISANPRETNAFFDELSKSYTYDKLKTVIQFLLHSVGSDLRSKGPSIPRGELSRLFNETRSLQAILGVYRFFQSRMGLIEQLFASEELALPKGLTFETLAKLFMKLLEERYPTGMKILRSAGQLTPEEEIAAMLIIISQWRDGIRNVAPRLYKSGKQRDDLLNAIMEALEELEEQEEERRRKIIEEEEEEEEKKRREKRGK